MARSLSASAVLAVGLLLGCSQGAPALDAKPIITSSGTPRSTPPPLFGPGWNIGGGGADVDEAMQALVDLVRGGASSSNKVDIVVLRCDNSSGYNAPWAALRGVNAVSTVVGTSAADFNDAAAAALIRNAGVVFFAGGDQANYVNWIKGSACDSALQDLIARGGGVGGTSAGTAIQGAIIFDSIAADAAGAGNVTSAQALANPYDPGISFTTGWFTWPHFEDLICEPHFGDPAASSSNKDRMGRIMAFLARQTRDRSRATWALCVDAATSLVVDRNGMGTVMGSGLVYLVHLPQQPEQCTPGQPLTCSGYRIWRLANGQTLNLAQRPNCSYYLGAVKTGSLQGAYYSPGPLITACGGLNFSTQPQAQTIQPGQTATFSATPTGGTPPYRFQWLKTGAPISGATSASYTTPSATAADNDAAFVLRVTDANDSSLDSVSALLTVGAPVTSALVNGGFENGSTGWTPSGSDLIGSHSVQPPYAGTRNAYLCGRGRSFTDTLRQTLSLPATLKEAKLSFHLHIDTAETSSRAYDNLYVQLLSTGGTLIKTLATYSNLQSARGYSLQTLDLSAYKGRQVQLQFKGIEDSVNQTSFVIDEVSLSLR